MTMSDADRIKLATRLPFGRRYYGPVESVPCDDHPTETVKFRWTWRVGETIEHGDCELVAGCPACDIDPDDDD